MSIFGSKDKEKNVVCDFTHIDGIDDLPKGASLKVSTDDENRRINMEAKYSKRLVSMLSYSQICAAEILSEKDVVEKGKSVVGRAVVGGILLGPLGAIVGGMSGVGGTRKEEAHYYVVLNYHPSSAPDETKAISFEPVGVTPWDKFIKKIKDNCIAQPSTSGGYL